MSDESNSRWVGVVLKLILTVVVVASAILIPRCEKPVEETKGDSEPEHLIEILHYHQPRNPDSEQLAERLNAIGKKYGNQVLVTRVDITTHPQRAAAERVANPPKVVIMAGTVRAFEFSGLWPLDRIEQKVEEILRGLKRVGKDWRPPVSGMSPGSTAPGPAAPGSPAPPISPAPPVAPRSPITPIRPGTGPTLPAPPFQPAPPKPKPAN